MFAISAWLELLPYPYAGQAGLLRPDPAALSSLHGEVPPREHHADLLHREQQPLGGASAGERQEGTVQDPTEVSSPSMDHWMGSIKL